MNAACLIAACAAASRRASQNNKGGTATENFEPYYKVKLRKYYHFNSLLLVTSARWMYPWGAFDKGKAQCLGTATVPEITLAVEHSFSIKASECTNGVDTYIQDNLDRISTTGEWLNSEKEIIAKYISEVNKTYSINPKEKDITWTNEFYWEVC